MISRLCCSEMAMLTFLLAVSPLLFSAVDATTPLCGGKVTMVTRSEWEARPPKTTPVNIYVPVNMTFIHHSAGSRGTNSSECIRIAQGIQNFHMDDRGWNDVGYSFLVCEDGLVYEGRGWNVEGAHTLGYNSVSLGFCIMGDFTSQLPLPEALNATQELIACGVDEGYIKSDYELFGHRDGRYGTECPGDELYALIRDWSHYSTRQIHKFGTPDSTSTPQSTTVTPGPTDAAAALRQSCLGSAVVIATILTFLLQF